MPGASCVDTPEPPPNGVLHPFAEDRPLMQSLTLNGVLRKQGFRMLSCTRVACIRPQHPAELFDDLRAVESCHGGVGHLGPGGLLDPEVMLGKGSYLRQVGDAENLSLLAEPTQLL